MTILLSLQMCTAKFSSESFKMLWGNGKVRFVQTPHFAGVCRETNSVLATDLADIILLHNMPGDVADTVEGSFQSVPRFRSASVLSFFSLSEVPVYVTSHAKQFGKLVKKYLTNPRCHSTVC